MNKKELKIEDQIKKMSIKDIEQLCAELEYRLKEGKLDDLSKILLEALLSYGKLTILGRAFPRVEDGLKPVHRRILYGMDSIGLTPSSPFKKCAKITGTIIAEYHPHGDCLSGDTEVFLMNGTIKTLKDLTEAGEAVEILSLNQKTNKLEPKIAHSFRIGQYTNKEYHIHLSNNTVVKATENHPFNIIGKGWVKAENLEINMIIDSVVFENNKINKIDNISISKIFTVKVDNKPMYDFTVNDNENMYIVSKIENNKTTLINVHNSSVYDALVRMGQEFSLRELLIIGQGNFGSIEGDIQASSRYTEATVSKVGGSFFKDIEKNIVDFIPNYDETTSEPTVLPVRFPNLIVNGTSGIAVGMVSKVPTHNPLETINLTKYFIEQKKAKKTPELEKMLEILPAPDFPTGGIIYNTQSMKDVFLTGIAKMKLRAKYEIEKTNRKESIVITEIPYMVKIPAIYTKLQEVINNKKEEQQYEIFKKSISDVRNETSKKGLRIVIDLKTGVDAEFIWNQLIKVCALDETISYYMNLVDKNGQVKVMGMIEILEHFVSFRKEIIYKKYLFIKEETEAELELVEGYIKALSMIDIIIKLIRESENDTVAFIEIKNLGFSDRQTKAILNLRLNRLTKLEKHMLEEQKEKLEKTIKNSIKIMESDTLKYNEMLSDLDDVEKLFERKERLTEINNNLEKITNEDLIKREECQIYLTNIGYLRRETISLKQNKKSRKGFELSENDFILQTFNSDSHSSLLFITDKGNVFGVKTYSIPDRDKGKHYTQLFDLPKTEKIVKVLAINDFDENIDLIMITKKGYIKRTKLSDYNGSLRKTGVIGIKLSEKDEIAYADIISGNEGEAIIINTEGKIIRFGLEEVPSVGRNSQGVIAMRFDDTEFILNCLIGEIREEGSLITISNNGIIKSTPLEEFKKQKRAGKGVLALKTNSKIGEISKAIIINSIDNDLITLTRQGFTNRMSLTEAINQGKGVNGFKSIKIEKKDTIIELFLAETIQKEESED